MDNITYDVRIWKSEIYKGEKVTTYKVRWKTGPRPWKKAFRTKAQAASFEAELRSAARRGDAFDITTGRPVSWGNGRAPQRIIAQTSHGRSSRSCPRCSQATGASPTE